MPILADIIEPGAAITVMHGTGHIGGHIIPDVQYL